MSGLALLLLIGLALATGILVAVNAWVLTHPPRRSFAWAVSRGKPADPSEMDPPAPFESWEFVHGSRKSPVWDVKGNAHAGPTIILTHGWGDSRLGALVRLPSLVEVASRIVIWDLPGHGEASGHCRLGSRHDEAALRSLIEQVGDQRIVLYGWSLGAGLSIAAAIGAQPVVGVIAEAPYAIPSTPARNVLTLQRLPVFTLRPAMVVLSLMFGHGLRWRGFDRREWASKLEVPLLIIHGEHDAVCPFADGAEIAAKARLGRLLEVPGGDHNRLWTNPESGAVCREGVVGFLQELERSRGQDQPNAFL